MILTAKGLIKMDDEAFVFGKNGTFFCRLLLFRRLAVGEQIIYTVMKMMSERANYLAEPPTTIG
jgi:hypothetical protein